MFRELGLTGFKNFREAKLSLGDLTLLVGTNASGKSNLRDAFRFLHGVSRGYTLAEIIGEKWIEGGALQWKGIRGGTRETAYRGRDRFALKAFFAPGRLGVAALHYEIEVSVGDEKNPPRVVRECLHETFGEMVFDSYPPDDAPSQEDPRLLSTRLSRGGDHRKHGPRLQHMADQPVLSQIAHDSKATGRCRANVKNALAQLASMRFLDLAPDAMRLPSLPGQDILADRGENLSSVLQAICRNEHLKRAILEWIKELTPQDVVDFDFVADQTGRILATLVESGGLRTSLYSASDGTLRFLGMIAALLGPKPAQFYFFEELDNGIHPTRLHLLLQLIEQRVSHGGMQVVTSSHSPQLLGFLSEDALKSASLVYRPADQPDARIQRILDIPEAMRVIEEQDIARLHASGWLEDAVAFLEAEQAPA
jgi:predicted ATPase